MTKQEIIKSKIESLGYMEVEDRDMSENYGHLYKRLKKDSEDKFMEGGHIQLQYWRVHPRIRTSVYSKTAFDTGIVTEDELIEVLEKAEKHNKNLKENIKLDEFLKTYNKANNKD